MAVDKFGHFEDYVKEQVLTGPPGKGFKTTLDGHFDLDNKLLKNVLDPRDDGDAANRRFVLSLTPPQESDHWSFSNKRLSNVADALYEGEAVTLRMLKDLSLNRITDLSVFNAEGARIVNLKPPTDFNDAATLNSVLLVTGNIQDQIKEDIKVFETEVNERIKRLGKALFKYIHAQRNRTANPAVDENTYLNWEQILGSPISFQDG